MLSFGSEAISSSLLEVLGVRAIRSCDSVSNWRAAFALSASLDPAVIRRRFMGDDGELGRRSERAPSVSMGLFNFDMIRRTCVCVLMTKFKS